MWARPTHTMKPMVFSISLSEAVLCFSIAFFDLLGWLKHGEAGKVTNAAPVARNTQLAASIPVTAGRRGSKHSAGRRGSKHSTN